MERLYGGFPASGGGESLWVCPTTKTTIRQVILANNTASAETVTLQVYTPTVDLDLIPTLEVPANSVTVVDVSAVVLRNEELWGAQGTTDAISVWVMGEVETT